MLALTKKTDYALIAVSHMALAGDRVSSAREMANLYQLSLSLLMNVLKVLTRKGLIRSTRGSKGGYVLAHEAKNITMHRLIVAVEGPLRLARCNARGRGHDDDCDLVETCPIRSPVRKVQQKLEEFLDSTTLAEIAMERPKHDSQNPLAAGAQAL